MYNNNTNVNGYKKLSPTSTQKQKEEYNQLVESVNKDLGNIYGEDSYTEISESEWNDYLDRLEKEYYRRNPEELNESDAYWGVSPFDWMKSIKIPNIFKPLKWLAALLAGGLALLLAGLYKALKEGKKQIAIARVRKWIKTLVVTADGGYKKTRKTKDSLFLIEARARRDILQAAVMSGYAAGLDIPEKHNEPANPIESAKNESIDLNGMDGFLFEASSVENYIKFNGEDFPCNQQGWSSLIQTLRGLEADVDSQKFEWVDKNGANKGGVINFDKVCYLMNVDPNVAKTQLVQQNNIKYIKYKDKTYENKPVYLLRLADDLKRDGEDYKIAQLSISQDGQNFTPMNSEIKNYFIQRVSNLQNQQSQQEKETQNLNLQKEIDSVSDCTEFATKKGERYPNNPEGLLKLYNDLESNGFNPTRTDSIPSLTCVNTDGTTTPIQSTDAKRVLVGRLSIVKRNEKDKVKAEKELEKERQKQDALNQKEEEKQKNQKQIELVNDTDRFLFKEQQYTNDADGLTKLIQNIKNDGLSINKGEYLPTIYALDDRTWKKIDSTEAKRYLSNRLMSVEKCQGDKEKIEKELDKERQKEEKEQQKQELLKNRENVNQMLNMSYDQDIELPDDSQVDWSLMNTLVASSWFGLVKHKTDLWKEAKSAFKMSIDDIETENDRQQYITNVITNINAALSKITTPSIARNYTNVLNQMVTNMLNRTTNGSRQMMSRDSAANTGIKIGNHGSYNESMDMDSYISYLNEATVTQNNQPQSQGTSINLNLEDLLGNQNKREVEIDYDKSKNLLDNTCKAMQNIFTANPSTDFLVYKKTSEQMNNFLNELTKSVHLIIDSVAKKVAEQNHNSKTGVDGAINSFLSDKGDPKQNRSLKNLWDNIGRPQLDSRAVTRCQSLTQSPEFTWYIALLTNTIPACVMKVFTETFAKDTSVISTSTDSGKKSEDSAILANGVNNQNNYKNEIRLNNQNNPPQNQNTQ